MAHVLGGVLRSAQIRSYEFRSSQDISDLNAQAPDRQPLAAVTGIRIRIGGRVRAPTRRTYGGDDDGDADG